MPDQFISGQFYAGPYQAVIHLVPNQASRDQLLRLTLSSHRTVTNVYVA
jgi:hypothetical protein